jgi:hypothetical protein
VRRRARTGGRRRRVLEIPEIVEIPRDPNRKDFRVTIPGDLNLQSDPTPESVLWDALLDRQNIYAIAYRLYLGPKGSVETWRQFVVWLASTELFWQARPRRSRLKRPEWERWRELNVSSRKRLDLLRKLIYGVNIWREADR